MEKCEKCKGDMVLFSDEKKLVCKKCNTEKIQKLKDFALKWSERCDYVTYTQAGNGNEALQNFRNGNTHDTEQIESEIFGDSLYAEEI